MGHSEQARLHLDADTSRRKLHKILREHGYDVTRTPNDWITFDATDEEQLLQATRRGRIIFTFNVGDFSRLTQKYSDHAGILLANQLDWPLSSQIKAVDRLIKETGADEWRGQVRWLNEWLR